MCPNILIPRHHATLPMLGLGPGWRERGGERREREGEEKEERVMEEGRGKGGEGEGGNGGTEERGAK